MNKKIIALIMTLAMASTLVACSTNKPVETHAVNIKIGDNANSNETKEEKEPDTTSVPENTTDDSVELLEGKYAVLIEVENYGNIFVELDADEAPITVTNFMKLVNEDYYSGLTFHRIIEGFMMQGGMSKEKPAATIKGEFAVNGISNQIKHERGTISMARTNDPDSASSQFFICHQDSFFLDGQYAAFGHVVTGMDVVDKICEEAIVIDDNGSVAPENQPVITAIYDVTAEYRNDVLGEGQFVPSNSFEESLGRDTFDSYDEIISLLEKGMAYAYVEIIGADDPILLVNTEGTYDYGDGTMAAIEATPYIKTSDGTVSSGSILSSGGTAYPLSVKDGIIYCGSNHTMEGSCLTNNKDCPGIMGMFYLYEDFDENANVTYGGFIRDTNDVLEPGADVAEDDGKPLEDAFESFNAATPIAFTIVE